MVSLMQQTDTLNLAEFERWCIRNGLDRYWVRRNYVAVLIAFERGAEIGPDIRPSPPYDRNQEI